MGVDVIECSHGRLGRGFDSGRSTRVKHLLTGKALPSSRLSLSSVPRIAS